jgi:hypothetical protein
MLLRLFPVPINERLRRLLRIIAVPGRRTRRGAEHLIRLVEG